MNRSQTNVTKIKGSNRGREIRSKTQNKNGEREKNGKGTMAEKNYKWLERKNLKAKEDNEILKWTVVPTISTHEKTSKEIYCCTASQSNRKTRSQITAIKKE